MNELVPMGSIMYEYTEILKIYLEPQLKQMEFRRI